MKTIDFLNMTDEERKVAFVDLCTSLVETAEHREAIEALRDGNVMVAEEMDGMFGAVFVAHDVST